MDSPGIIFDQKLFRHDVRRDVRNCVLFLIFYFAINLIVTLIITVAYLLKQPEFVSYVTDMTPELLSGTAPELNPNLVNSLMDGDLLGWMSIIGAALGSCVFFIYRKKRFITDVMLPATEPLTPRIFIILVVITQGVQIVYSLVIMLVDYLLPGALSLQESYAEIMEGLFTPIGLLYVIIIGPIFEELVFRGAVLGALRRFGANFAIIFSSILFGFFHAVILQIPFAFVLGLLLGYVAVRWSLRASIALHIVVNGLSCLLSVSEQEAFQTTTGMIMAACAAVSVIMAIRWRESLKTRIREGAAYYANTYKYGFSSILLWVFLAGTTAFGIVQMIGAAGLILS